MSIERVSTSTVPTLPEPTAPTAVAAPDTAPIDLTADRAEAPPAATRRTAPDVSTYVDGIADAYIADGNGGVERFLRANPRAAECLARERTEGAITGRLETALHERMSFDPFGVRSGPAALAIYGEVRETLRGTLMEEMRREASREVEGAIRLLSGADPEAVRDAINHAPLGSPLFRAAERMDLIGRSGEDFAAHWGARMDDLRALRGHLAGTTWEAGAMPEIRDRVLARHGLRDVGAAHDAIRAEHREHAELAHLVENMADMVMAGGTIMMAGHIAEPVVEAGLSMAAANGVALGLEVEPNHAEEALFGSR